MSDQQPAHEHFGFPMHITRKGRGVWDKSCSECVRVLNEDAGISEGLESS